MNDAHSKKSKEDDPADQSGSNTSQPRSLAEQVSFGIASLILASLIGAVCYLGLWKREQAPANPIITRDQPIFKLSEQYYVPFELTNQGDLTAESVQVIAELRSGDEVVETGEQQIDFLSSHETESGTFIFSRDPRQGELVIRVASYKHP
jgi:uncharacterized protein (TIGR02588 family)